MSSCLETLDKIKHYSYKYDKVKNLYRQMTNELDLWIQAYANTYSNKGSMTPGVVNDTVDGKSLNEMKKIMNVLKAEKYYPKPVRRTYIEKKLGGRRPLGLPVYTDKLVQEVMRMQLSAIYERPDETIFHELLNLVNKRVEDGRYIKLIKKFLKAGYMEDWNYHSTLSGTPQGGILSPLLANIYLHELDEYIHELMKKWNSKVLSWGISGNLCFLLTKSVKNVAFFKKVNFEGKDNLTLFFRHTPPVR